MSEMRGRDSQRCGLLSQHQTNIHRDVSLSHFKVNEIGGPVCIIHVVGVCMLKGLFKCV